MDVCIGVGQFGQVVVVIEFDVVGVGVDCQNVENYGCVFVEIKRVVGGCIVLCEEGGNYCNVNVVWGQEEYEMWLDRL